MSNPSDPSQTERTGGDGDKDGERSECSFWGDDTPKRYDRSVFVREQCVCVGWRAVPEKGKIFRSTLKSLSIFVNRRRTWELAVVGWGILGDGTDRLACEVITKMW